MPLPDATGWVPQNYASPFDDPFSPYYGMTPEQYAEMTGLNTGNAVPYTTPLGGWTGTLAPNAATPEALANYAQYEDANQSFREENSWFDPAMLALMGGLTAGAATGLIGGGSGTAAGSLTPVTVGATPLAGGAPAVDAAAAAGLAGNSGMAAFPALTGSAASLPIANTLASGASALPPGTEIGPNGLPTGPGIPAAPLTGGTGAVGGGLLPGVTSGAGGLSGLTNPPNVSGGVPDWVGNYLLPGLNGLMGYITADRATDAQANALQAAIDEQRRQYDLNRADYAPYLQTGTSALGRLNALSSGDMSGFNASPDYNFRRTEGTRGLENSFAARGGALSGNALRALTDFNSGLASQEYGNYWNRQAGLAGIGQTATAGVTNAGQNTSANVSNALTDMGATRASGLLGRGSALTGAANDAIYNYLYRRGR